MAVATHALAHSRESHPSSPDRQEPPIASTSSLSASAGSEFDLDAGLLFHRVLDAVVVARLATGRIVLWNPAAQRLFGYSATEAIGKSVEILMPEAIAPVHRAGIERYTRTGHGLIVDAGEPVEMPARTKGGDEIRIELALSEVRNSRGERFAMAVIRDATLRKQIETTNLELIQTRLARSEAEAVLAARDELLDSVTRELESDASPEEKARLVRVLVDFSRLRHGVLAMRTVDSDLVDLVHAACDAARRHMAGRRLRVHTPPTAPGSFDPARLRQVLDHLIEEITLRTGTNATIDVRVEVLPPQLVQLSIRTDGVTSTRPPGPALQLSRALMQRQGGSLTFDTSASGSLEVIMTMVGSPRLVRQRLGRPRRPGRLAPSS